MPYRYALQQGGAKYPCPACHQKRFVRYIDTTTGSHLADHVGRCDREDSCAYHLTPNEFFSREGTTTKATHATKPPQQKPEPKPEPQLPPSSIDPCILQATLAQYNSNNFCRWLCSIFGQQRAFQLTATYRIGTSKHWPGATIFWQIDQHHNIRSGKIMLYNPQTGKRIRHPFNHITWVHKALNLHPYHLHQCLFGEHLLTTHPKKPVAIVESEKTAIIAAGFIPDYLWLATAGKGNLNPEKLKPLYHRHVKLYPDLGACEKWQTIAASLPNVTVSTILEQRATLPDRTQGLDLADYLLDVHNPPL